LIGQHLVPLLTTRRHQVTVLDVLPPPSSLSGISYEHLRGDVLDQDWLEANWPARIEGIIHLIGLANSRQAQENPTKSFQLNVLALERILEVARRSSPQQVVLPSAAAVYGSPGKEPASETTPTKPLNVYSYHKLIAELLLQACAQRYGFSSTVLRLHIVYGRGQGGIIGQAIRKAQAGEPFVLFGADQVRDFVYVGDVVDAFVRAVESRRAGNHIFNIGSGVGLTIGQVVALVKELWPQLQVQVAPTASEVHIDSVSDVRLAKELLGWRPHDSLDFLRERIAKEMNGNE
ncbi:MAG: NAD-dependent epimerase/dehydratase family protein, partial [Chloroflexi bacterium]|nr:NAD-dependent epimerase/dehydratase family protein [Chloroflexota bacterium]